jgi:hypothetical protein
MSDSASSPHGKPLTDNIDDLKRENDMLRVSRDRLLAACQAVHPTFYGLLLQAWGNPDTWEPDRQGTVVYRQLLAALEAEGYRDGQPHNTSTGDLLKQRDQAIAHGAALQAELTAARGACHRTQAALAEVAEVTRDCAALLTESRDYLTDEATPGVIARSLKKRITTALAALDVCPHLRTPTQIADEPWSPERWREENPTGYNRHEVDHR